MTIILGLINFLFSYMMWNNSKEYFAKDDNRWGWFCVAGSALNFAAGVTLFIKYFY